MTGMTNEELIESRFREMVEGSGAGKAMVFEKYASPDCLYFGPAVKEPVRGAEALQATVSSWREAFPDLKTRVMDVVAQGDVLMARVMTTGTYTGNLLGRPGTGKTAEWELRVWARFEDGMMVEDRTIFDRLGLYEQLGIAAD